MSRSHMRHAESPACSLDLGELPLGVVSAMVFSGRPDAGPHVLRDADHHMSIALLPQLSYVNRLIGATAMSDPLRSSGGETACGRGGRS